VAAQRLSKVEVGFSVAAIYPGADFWDEDVRPSTLFAIITSPLPGDYDVFF